MSADACSAGPRAGASSPASIWLARHATPLVESAVCYGQLDVPADAGATAASARALAAALPPGIRVVRSPLQRCEQLAQTLCGLRPDLVCKTDRRLMELNFGSWEGRRWADIGQAAIDLWVADFASHRPGGGESVAALMQRVAAVWDEPRDAATLWITHAGVICAATLLHRGQRQVSSADQWPAPASAPGFGEWTVLK